MTFVTAQSVAQFICYRDSSGKGCGAVCLSAAMLIISETLRSCPPKGNWRTHRNFSMSWEPRSLRSCFQRMALIWSEWWWKVTAQLHPRKMGCAHLGQTTCALCWQLQSFQWWRELSDKWLSASQWRFVEGFITQDEKVIQFPYHVRDLRSFAKPAWCSSCWRVM